MRQKTWTTPIGERIKMAAASTAIVGVYLAAAGSLYSFLKTGDARWLLGVIPAFILTRMLLAK